MRRRRVGNRWNRCMTGRVNRKREPGANRSDGEYVARDDKTRPGKGKGNGNENGLRGGLSVASGRSLRVTHRLGGAQIVRGPSVGTGESATRKLAEAHPGVIPCGAVRSWAAGILLGRTGIRGRWGFGSAEATSDGLPAGIGEVFAHLGEVIGLTSQGAPGFGGEGG